MQLLHLAQKVSLDANGTDGPQPHSLLSCIVALHELYDLKGRRATLRHSVAAQRSIQLIETVWGNNCHGPISADVAAAGWAAAEEEEVGCSASGRVWDFTYRSSTSLPLPISALPSDALAGPNATAKGEGF
jgi:hypothetical protein